MPRCPRQCTLHTRELSHARAVCPTRELPTHKQDIHTNTQTSDNTTGQNSARRASTRGTTDRWLDSGVGGAPPIVQEGRLARARGELEGDLSSKQAPCAAHTARVNSSDMRAGIRAGSAHLSAKVQPCRSACSRTRRSCTHNRLYHTQRSAQQHTGHQIVRVPGAQGRAEPERGAAQARSAARRAWRAGVGGAHRRTTAQPAAALCV